jgi:hypothetical protein
VGAPGGSPFALHQAHPHRARVPHGDAAAPHTGRPTTNKGVAMPYLQHIAPVTALIAGVLILVMPKLLNYIIALYLIVIGLVGLFGR